jgi:hypothetical protein
MLKIIPQPVSKEAATPTGPSSSTPIVCHAQVRDKSSFDMLTFLFRTPILLLAFSSQLSPNDPFFNRLSRSLPTM